MADFSKAKCQQQISPAPLYPFAALDPVWLNFTRYDVFYWSAGTAIGQLLITNSGWQVDTRVSIVYATGVVIGDTVAAISEAAGNTSVTFTNSGVASGAKTIINLDYTGYRLRIRIRADRPMSGTSVLLPVSRELVAPFSPDGRCSVNVADAIRDLLSLEEVGNASVFATATASKMIAGAFSCEIDFRVECSGRSGVYGWDSIGGENSAATFYYAAEHKGAIFDPAGSGVPGSPNLYLQSVRDQTGTDAPFGGLLMARGAAPLWRTKYGRLVGAMALVWRSDSAATLTVKIKAGATALQTYNLTSNGYWLLSKPSLPANISQIVITADGAGSTNTMEDVTISVCESQYDLYYLVWENEYGGFSSWGFENHDGESFLATAGAVKDSFVPFIGNYGSTLAVPNNSNQMAIGRHRTPPKDQALEIAVKEDSLSYANVLYLRSLLTAGRVWLCEIDGEKPYQFTPVTVSGEAPVLFRQNDLYKFSATIKRNLQ